MRRGLALAGCVLVLAGVVGYFAVVLAVPALVPYVRNHAVPNWALVAMGLVISVLAVGRAGAWMPRVLLGVNVVVIV